MVLGNCTICTGEKAKYKCSKCEVQYCSLKCYKSPDHKHEEVQEKKNDDDHHHHHRDDKKVKIQPPTQSTKYSDIFNDDKIKYMLSFKALQIHLRSIYEILINNSIPFEKKQDLANEKLTSLRTTGSNENELVEEFCQYVTQLLSKSKVTS